MFGIYATNPDESLFASIAWTLWTEGRLATDLLQGALPGIEYSVYWTPPFYYFVLAGWQGLFGPGLLSVRSLSLILGLALVVILWQRHRGVGASAWTACGLILFDPALQRAASMGRMDMLAITLTVGSLTVLEVCRETRRDVGAGMLAAAAFLTHPLGAAAIAAVGLTSLLRGRRPLLLFLCGSAPLLLAGGLYIAVDVDTFVAQMQLQLEVKAGRARSPLDNLQRVDEFFGNVAPLMLAAFLGGMAGLIVGRRELFPWLIGAVSLVPVILLSGELIYPAYMAPFTAVGLGWWLRLSRWARRALLAAVLGFGVTLAIDPPPLAGIDPYNNDYCANVASRLGANHSVVLAVVPDPWFCLRKRSDLQIRLAPPVHLTREQLRTYLAKADDVVLGGYNPPGFDDVVREWDNWAKPGQRLWIVDGEVYSFAEYREHLRLSRHEPDDPLSRKAAANRRASTRPPHGDE